MAQPDRNDNLPANPPPARPTEPSDMAQQFQLVMMELRKTRDDMQPKFNTLQEEITARQDNATERVVKKLKVDQGYTFKKEGHEHQFRFNVEIEERIVKAQTEAAKIKLARTKEARALETLQQELKEGIQLIALQQKHIKVADRSEFGWATVEE